MPVCSMSAIKRVFSKVSSHSRSPSGSNSPEPRRSLANGTAKQNGDVHVEKTGKDGPPAAQKQQHAEHRFSRERRKSFTEQKEDRKVEREAQDEEEAKARRKKYERLRAEVRPSFAPGQLGEFNAAQDPLRDNYGDFPLNQSQAREGEHPPM